MTADLAARPQHQWLRTYRGHQPGGAPFDGLGTQDITVEVCIDQLPQSTSDMTQAEFLRAHGIDDLVADGRRVWEERKAIGDLQAMTARSRITEAQALTDPNGLGAFRVFEWA
jgi:SAM-dependent MidA family methyltransferase